MNVYFQFLTQNQSKDAIGLVRIPALLDAEKKIGGTVKTSSGGGLSSSRFEDVELVPGNLSKIRLNEMEVTYDIKQLETKWGILPIRQANAIFAPSATSEIWFPSEEFIQGDRASRNRKQNASTQEGCLAGLRITRKPAILELVLQLETSKSKDEILRYFAEWLGKSLVGMFSTLEVFGCCDVGGPGLFVRLESNVLMAAGIRIMAKVLPTGYPELGEKFDDLHPLMFGAERTCSGLAAALGSDAKLSSGAEGSHFAVIQLSPKCNIAAARERAEDWLVESIA